MDLKVNDYVRCTGSIGIRRATDVIKNDKTQEIEAFKDEKGITIDLKYVLKYDKKPLNLIEKGDLVNGYIITHEYIMSDGTIYQEGARFNRMIPLKNKDIKTFITHEQLESISYKVK